MLFEVIMSAAVFCFIAAVCVKLFAVSGWCRSDCRVVRIFGHENGLCENADAGTLCRVFVYALVFRVIVFLFGALMLYTLCGEKELSLSAVVSSYHRWDADHYINIARGGYSSKLENGRYVLLVFYPLFPLLMRFAAAFTRSYDVAGLAVSWLCYAGACTAMTALVCIDYGRETAKRSVLYLSVFPFAFFFGACMSESTFLLMCVLSVYFMRSHNWFLAALFGLFASLSRVTGVMLVFAYFAEWVQHGQVGDMLRNKEWKKLWNYVIKCGLPVLVIPLGTLIYMLINYCVSNNAFAFLEYERVVWHQSMQFFPITFRLMREYAVDVSRMPEMFAVWIPQIAAIVLCVAVSLWGIGRNRAVYYGFLIAYLITNISASWPISGARYMSCAFPVFIFLADFAGVHKRAQLWIFTSFAMLFSIYFAAYFKNLIC